MNTDSTQVAGRRRLRIRHRLLLALGASAFAVGLAEVSVRVLGIAREVGPSFTDWHATDGLHVRRSIRVTRTTPEYSMQFTSNADGYRGAELPTTFERSILFLGDSYTMGYGVSDGSEFPALIAARSPVGLAVVNAGIGGTGNGRWLHVLQRERDRLRPAVVVMQLSQNDVPDNLRERLFELDASGALVARAPSPPTSARRLQAWLDCVPGVSYLHLVGLGRQLLGPRQSAVDSSSGASVREAVDGQDDQGLRLQRAILVAAVRAVREMGATPLLVTADFSEAAARPVQAFAAELGVRYVRIPGKGERPELYYRIDDHWNAAGHAHVAALLEEELRRPEYGGLYRSMR